MSSRYFFIIDGPDHHYDDEGGTPLPDKEAALAYAERVVKELNGDSDRYHGCLLIVQDALRNPLFSIPF